VNIRKQLSKVIDGELWTYFEPIKETLLTKSEKALAANGEFPTKCRGERMIVDKYLRRRAGNLGKKKKRTKKKERRRPSVVYPNHEIPMPSVVVEEYIERLKSTKMHTYSSKVNRLLQNHVLNESDSKRLTSLDPVPAYRLKRSNRIFCSGTWQTMDRDLRKVIFSSDYVADFKSMHFEIFASLVRRYCPEQWTPMEELIGDSDIWSWYESHGIHKSTAKVPLQALLNGMSQTKSLSLIFQDGMDIEGSELLRSIYEAQGVKGIREYLDELPIPVKRLTTLLSNARNALQNRIKMSQVRDGFGTILVPYDSNSYLRQSGKWEDRKYVLDRKTMNSLYSSFELRIMSETMLPVLQKFKRFKILLHLHDGLIFSCDKRDFCKVSEQIRRYGTEIMNQLEVRSSVQIGRIQE
jgi:hypothetical protein